jgi:hypothetical protein
MTRPHALIRWLLYVVLLSAGTVSLTAQAEKPAEYDVKAAYLYNFGKFVRWPENAGAEGQSFSICVLGKDPFGKILDSVLDGGSWQGKPVAAKRIVSVDEAASCNLLFVSSSESERLGQILSALERRPILTVSDSPMFSRRGGIIEFVLTENRVRFEVNAAAAEKAGLNINSQLLKIATRVRQTAQIGEQR